MNMKLSNQGLSGRDEFINYIESFGFKYIGYNAYGYKEFEIFLYNDCYDFYNGSEWINQIPYNDLTLVLKLTRGIKLIQLLR